MLLFYLVFSKVITGIENFSRNIFSARKEECRQSLILQGFKRLKKFFKKGLDFCATKLYYNYGPRNKGGEEMKNRNVGRPTDNPKFQSIHVRLDEECKEILENFCTQKKIPRAEAIRRGIKKLKI